jgi:hypothetical protein
VLIETLSSIYFKLPAYENERDPLQRRTSSTARVSSGACRTTLGRVSNRTVRSLMPYEEQTAYVFVHTVFGNVMDSAMSFNAAISDTQGKVAFTQNC